MFRNSMLSTVARHAADKGSDGTAPLTPEQAKQAQMLAHDRKLKAYKVDFTPTTASQHDAENGIIRAVTGIIDAVDKIETSQFAELVLFSTDYVAFRAQAEANNPTWLPAYDILAGAIRGLLSTHLNEQAEAEAKVSGLKADPVPLSNYVLQCINSGVKAALLVYWGSVTTFRPEWVQRVKKSSEFPTGFYRVELDAKGKPPKGAVRCIIHNVPALRPYSVMTVDAAKGVTKDVKRPEFLREPVAKGSEIPWKGGEIATDNIPGLPYEAIATRDDIEDGFAKWVDLKRMNPYGKVYDDSAERKKILDAKEIGSKLEAEVSAALVANHQHFDKATRDAIGSARGDLQKAIESAKPEAIAKAVENLTKVAGKLLERHRAANSGTGARALPDGTIVGVADLDIMFAAYQVVLSGKRSLAVFSGTDSDKSVSKLSAELCRDMWIELASIMEGRLLDEAGTLDTETMHDTADKDDVVARKRPVSVPEAEKPVGFVNVWNGKAEVQVQANKDGHPLPLKDYELHGKRWVALSASTVAKAGKAA